MKIKPEKCATKYLREQKISHSKSENLSFNGFKPAEYLLTKNLTTEEVRTLFQLRCERKLQLSGASYVIYLLRLECPELRIKTKKIIKFNEVEYRRIYGNLKNQEKAAKTFKILLEARKDILESL